MQKLQIIVSSDGRFRNLREALHRCDPPCIPYLGMYLSDLSFLEEGTPSLADDGLLNFSKLRMVSNIVNYNVCTLSFVYISEQTIIIYKYDTNIIFLSLLVF